MKFTPAVDAVIRTIAVGWVISISVFALVAIYGYTIEAKIIAIILSIPPLIGAISLLLFSD